MSEVAFKIEENKATRLVREAVAYCKTIERPIEFISLHPSYWDDFRRAMIDANPESQMDIDHFNEVHFHDVTVKKGSPLMIKRYEIKLKMRVSW